MTRILHWFLHLPRSQAIRYCASGFVLGSVLAIAAKNLGSDLGEVAAGATAIVSLVLLLAYLEPDDGPGGSGAHV